MLLQILLGEVIDMIEHPSKHLNHILDVSLMVLHVGMPQEVG
jgi:hypothetical protein